MISEEVEDLLNDLTPEKARALLDKLPELVPEDPTLAPLLAEEMAKAFGEAFTPAQKPVAANKEDQARGESGPGTNSGSFVKDGGAQTESPKAKAKREKRERQANNKATGVANMATVTGGSDCPDFMRSEKLGRIGFYQGNENEGYLHIKNNPDADHQAMLQGDAIPSTLAYGKYYRDVYKGSAGWSVVLGDKCVFLGSDGDGVKIVTAYVSKAKAAVFSRLTAIENKEV